MEDLTPLCCMDQSCLPHQRYRNKRGIKTVRRREGQQCNSRCRYVTKESTALSRDAPPGSHPAPPLNVSVICVLSVGLRFACLFLHIFCLFACLFNLIYIISIFAFPGFILYYYSACCPSVLMSKFHALVSCICIILRASHASLLTPSTADRRMS